MNPGEQPKIANCAPIHARNALPPHRACCCQNHHVMGLAHQNLLVAVAEMLDGNYTPVSGSWMADHINELMYRGIIMGEQPYALHSSQCPKTRTEWAYTLLEGYALPQETK